MSIFIYKISYSMKSLLVLVLTNLVLVV